MDTGASVHTGEQPQIKQGEQVGTAGTQAETGRDWSVLPATGGVVTGEQIGRSRRKTYNNAG